MSRGTGGRAVAAAGLAVLMFAAACGTDDNTTSTGATAGGGSSDQVQCASGTVAGAGSTFVATIVQQWIKDFGALCPGTTVNYQAVGSGAGIQQFTAGTVDFAGSDVVMKPEEQAAAEAKVGEVLHVPWSAGGVAVEYNLPSVPDLRLTPEALAGIYSGRITRWDDGAIAASNPDVRLPATPIQVIHRSDGSGTTAAFTAYLAAAAPSAWTAGSGKDIAWPTGQGAKGSDGVTAAVKQTEGAIGYAELSYPKGAGLPVAKIRNPAGNFVPPDGAAVSAALAEAEVPSDLKIEPTYTPQGALAYPISTPTFLILPANPGDGTKARLLEAFTLYALTEGQKAAESLFYAPLPETLVERATRAVTAISS